MGILLGNVIALIDQFIYFILIFMVLTYPLVKYSIKITYILGVYSLNTLKLPTNADLMFGCCHTRLVVVYQCLKYFPKQNLILAHYMIRSWWIQLIVGLLHYAILPRSSEQVVVITNILMDLGYTYNRSSLNNLPYIFISIINLL